jgi:hypothetical protein
MSPGPEQILARRESGEYYPRVCANELEGGPMRAPVLVWLFAARAETTSLPRVHSPSVILVDRSPDRIADLLADPFSSDTGVDGMNDLSASWDARGKMRFYRSSWASPDSTVGSFSYLPVNPADTPSAGSISEYLTVGLVANPCLADWDGDGLNDLLVGQFIEGRLRFYRNTGTNSDPAFSGYSYVRADQAVITTTYG